MKEFQSRASLNCVPHSWGKTAQCGRDCRLFSNTQSPLLLERQNFTWHMPTTKDLFLRLSYKSVWSNSDQWEVSAVMWVTTGFAFESNVLASPLPFPLPIAWNGDMMTGLRAAILTHQMEATYGGHQNPKREGILIWVTVEQTHHTFTWEKINFCLASGTIIWSCLTEANQIA